MKVLGDIPDGGDMAARCHDLHFEPNQPRIFTSNEKTPHGFHNAFPFNLKDMTNEKVLELDNNTKALLKRYALCEITTCLIPQALRDGFEASRSVSAPPNAREIFTESNAIP